MKKEVLRYLQTYSTIPYQVDRLIISTFLYSFSLEKTKNTFINNYLISEKDEDYAHLQDLLKIFQFSDLEELIEVFEFVISPEEKIVTGAIYTPKHIRDYIIDQCIISQGSLVNIKICDPACGCGGFLYSLAQKIHNLTGKSYQSIFAENIYGLDIELYAVNRSKLLLSLLALVEGENIDYIFNIEKGNALNFSWIKHYTEFEGFDVIVGNPPYVCSRNIDNESREYISDWKVCASGHPDLYIPFFQIGFENLRPNGVLGFITMNTFFKSVNGRALRQYFEEEAISLKILDFGGHQVFRSKSTYTCICFLQKSKSKSIKYVQGNEDLLSNNPSFVQINYSQLNHKNGWNLHYHDLLTHIENAGPSFGDLYQTRNGIATLKNNVYIFDIAKEDDSFYYIQNGAEYPIEKGVCKQIINPNKLNHDRNIDEILQKVIFPYKFDPSGDAKLIPQDVFKNQYPKAFEYLETKRSTLEKRDKGKGVYENWYAYGRNQSLERYRLKMFFPHITHKTPRYTISKDENLLFYNGIAVISNSEQELLFLQKLMGSKLFWFYLIHSSKPYGSGYFSMSRNYIKNFGVYEFNDEERQYIIEENNSVRLNKFIEAKYKIALPPP
jgi:methylase of polypeptide subunit release factors